MYTIIVFIKFNIDLSYYLCELYTIINLNGSMVVIFFLSINDITILIYELKIKHHNVLIKSSDILSTYIEWFGI